MAYQNFSGAWLADTNQAGVRYFRGGSGAEWMNGTSGADEFDGGGGLDTFAGGAGDDYYWVNTEQNPVIEQAGQGIDTIKTWSAHALPANVENLVVFGQNQYAAGNDLNNIIRGEDGSQFIYGGRGEDVLIGGGGADDFIVAQGEGNKVIQDFQPWNDHVRLIGGNLYSFEAVKAAMTQQGSDVILNNGGTMIAFRNMTVGQFQAQDFQLPINIGSLGAPTFNEDFNSLKLADPNNLGAGGWRPHFGYGGETGLHSFTLPRNNEQQIYVNPQFQGTTGGALGLNPFSVNNGVLTITANQASADLQSKMWGYKYTSGVLTTDVSFQQTYGYFEIKAELPQGQGLWPAFWLMSRNGTGNELDVLEGLGSNTKFAYNAYHAPGTSGDLSHPSFNPYGTGMHTYGMLWSQQNLVYYVDGAEVWRTATPPDMNTPMYMILNLAVGGPWAGSPDGTTPWPAQMKIDYVRAYNLPGTSTPTTPTTPTPTPTPDPAPSTGGGLVLAAKSAFSALVGGSGSDTITASDGGDTITSGGGSDVIVLGKEPWAPIVVKDFAVGSDKLDLTALLQKSGYTGSDPVADKYVSFKSNGAGGTEVFFDRDATGTAQMWPNRIVVLEGVSPDGMTWSKLSASAGGGTTAPPTTGGGSTGGGSTGGSGSGQVIVAKSAFSALNGGSGSDTITASDGGDTIVSGGGSDVIVLGKEPWAPIVVKDFVVSVDKLDLTALLQKSGYNGSDPVADKYVSFKGNGAGGAEVFFDRDATGTAQMWPNRIVTLEGVSPDGLTWAKLNAGGAAPSTGGSSGGGSTGTAGVVLTSSKVDDTLTGGAGNDTLNAGVGADRLTGGAGADVFNFPVKPWAPAHITDFQVGVDKADFSDIFDAFGYTGTDPIGAGYMKLADDGAGGTRVLFDRDAAATGQMWPDYAINVDHVTPATLMANSGWFVAQ